MTVPNVDFLEARIAGCRTVDDCYTSWNEIQTYLGEYDVTMETYRILFDKVKARYIEITGKDFTTYVEPTRGIM